jgi:hypothetical protein
MAISINDNIQCNSPKSVDNKYLKFGTTLYTSVSDVNTAIPQVYRHRGLTVLIEIGGSQVEYWYYGGVLDGDLIEKTYSVTNAEVISAIGYTPENVANKVVDLSSPSNTTYLTTQGLVTTLSQYFKQDGNSFGANASIGTNDNFALIFETNGIARGQVTSDGNFIFGSGSNTGHKVQIEGSMRLSSAAGTGTRLVVANSSGVILTEAKITVASHTSNFTVSSNNFNLVDSSAGNITATINTSISDMVAIKKISSDTNLITIVPSSGLIDGQASVTITYQYEILRIVSDGTNLYIV